MHVTCDSSHLGSLPPSEYCGSDGSRIAMGSGSLLCLRRESVRELSVFECLSKASSAIRVEHSSGGGGECSRAGAGVSTVGDDPDEEVGDGTKRDEVGVCAAPSSSVVGGNESGDGAG